MISVLIACLLVLVAGCTSGSDVYSIAERGGCTSVAVDYQAGPNRTVLSISARECRRGSSSRGGVLPAAEALDVLVRSAWCARGPRFDAVYASVYRTSEAPDVLRRRSVEQSREQLIASWGTRDPARDIGEPPKRGPGMEYIFGLVAIVWLVVSVRLVRGIRAGRVVPVILVDRPPR